MGVSVLLSLSEVTSETEKEVVRQRVRRRCVRLVLTEEKRRPRRKKIYLFPGRRDSDFPNTLSQNKKIHIFVDQIITFPDRKQVRYSVVRLGDHDTFPYNVPVRTRVGVCPITRSGPVYLNITVVSNCF